jgi:hypothetical protein
MLCPYPISAQSFNLVSTLGTLKINEFALKLKGREADLIKLAPIAAPKIRVRNLEVLQLDLLSRC